MIKYSTWRQLRKQGYIDCSYLQFAFVIPAKLFIEDLIWKLFKKDIHF